MGDTVLGQLMAAAPDPTTPLVLPYLSGERSTGWAAAARAVVVRASSATTGASLFRAAMEGVALSYQRITDQLRTTASPQRILASGRVTQDLPDWLRVVADVLGTPVEPVTLKGATLRGTALHAWKCWRRTPSGQPSRPALRCTRRRASRLVPRPSRAVRPVLSGRHRPA